MWPLEVSLAAIAFAAVAITFAGLRLVSVADEVADRSGLGEALIGATFLGATTSLADITAVTSAALDGHASMAVSAAVGGIAVQTAFLAVADMCLRRVNLEHAAASLPNLISASALIVILGLVLLAPQVPDVSLWHIHPITMLLFASYLMGMRLVQSGQDEPMWRPYSTSSTATDEPEPDAPKHSWTRLILSFLCAGGTVAFGGWVLSEAGSSLMYHVNLTESAVGGVIIAIATSLPELVTSVAAVRSGALTLAVGGIIGGNTFDVLMVGIADVAYTGGSVYHHIKQQDLALTAITLLMTAILLLGLLLRQRRGPGSIGLESLVVLLAYAGSIVLLVSSY